MDSIPISVQRKAQLEALAREQGKDLAATADDVLAIGIEQHQALAQEEQDIRKTLNRRYDEAVSGRVSLLDPADVRSELATRHAEYRHPR